MFVVELEGYNDGRPYEMGRWTDKDVALARLESLRKAHPSIPHRLIEVIKDYDDA